ncbi:hypothetical protein Y032_0022g541 [Ancylostoma ceylanicum]|uniref:Uncharacterized protein n=1 Tax=Ancylostoma ceylanicum TaxID=53326 RepID=A0A016UZ30_9BILA|nr:hypothetical protein Y032_0022g541 [Ancylostoma ceylanicum]
MDFSKQYICDLLICTYTTSNLVNQHPYPAAVLTLCLGIIQPPKALRKIGPDAFVLSTPTSMFPLDREAHPESTIVDCSSGLIQIHDKLFVNLESVLCMKKYRLQLSLAFLSWSLVAPSRMFGGRSEKRFSSLWPHSP